MPMVHRMLEKESSLKADRSLAPDEAVAHGAAIYAGILSGFPEHTSGVSVANINSHDLGVLGIDPKTKLPKPEGHDSAKYEDPGDAKQDFFDIEGSTEGCLGYRCRRRD